ncbi:hypothetical protein ACVNF4_08575 [Streptomyces sp. S6]
MLIAAGSLTACGSPSVMSGPELLGEAEILAEYERETGRLELAPGDTWDPDPRQLKADSPDPDGPMKFERGIGEQTAQFQWYCSWARSALTGKGAQRAAALARLEEFPTFSVWKAMDDNGHTLFTGISEEVSRDRTDALEEYVAGNCELP